MAEQVHDTHVPLSQLDLFSLLGRNGFEELVIDKHRIRGIQWKFSDEGRQVSAQMPNFAWLAIQGEAYQNWDKEAREKLNTHYGKIKARYTHRKALLKQSNTTDEYKRKKALAKLTVPSKMLLELRPLLQRSHEDCAVLRAIIKQERVPKKKKSKKHTRTHLTKPAL